MFVGLFTKISNPAKPEPKNRTQKRPQTENAPGLDAVSCHTCLLATCLLAHSLRKPLHAAPDQFDQPYRQSAADAHQDVDIEEREFLHAPCQFTAIEVTRPISMSVYGGIRPRISYQGLARRRVPNRKDSITPTPYPTVRVLKLIFDAITPFGTPRSFRFQNQPAGGDPFLQQ